MENSKFFINVSVLLRRRKVSEWMPDDAAHISYIILRDKRRLMASARSAAAAGGRGSGGTGRRRVG